jgi:hypothetical protein
MVFAGLIYWRKARLPFTSAMQGSLLFALTTLLLFLVTLRTLILSGILLVAPTFMVDIQELLGFRAKDFISILPDNDDWPSFPLVSGLWQMLFDPAGLSHIQITWVGNVWLFLLLLILVLSRQPCAILKKVWLLLLIGVSFFPILFMYRHPVVGGDGNYFIVPLVCLTITASYGVSHLPKSTRKILPVVLAIFAFGGGVVSFVTGSWGPGTRALDLNFTRAPFELDIRAKQELIIAKLTGVAQYFANKSEDTRVVGLEPSDSGSGLHAGWWLPLRYEPLLPFAWQNSNLVSSPTQFRSYLKDAMIEYILVPINPSEGQVTAVVESTLKEMSSAGVAVVAYRDDYYTVWRLDQERN